MECNAQSLRSVWSQSAKPCSQPHLCLTTSHWQIGGNLWNNMWCMKRGSRTRTAASHRIHCISGLISFCFDNDFSFLWFAVTWKTPEGNASGYPSLCWGEENWTKNWYSPLSHFIFCDRYHVYLACSKLLHMAALANFPQLVTWFHFSTLLSPKPSTQLHSSSSFITCYFTLNDTAVWFAYSFLKLHGKYLVRKWSGACNRTTNTEWSYLAYVNNEELKLSRMRKVDSRQ